MITTDGEGPRPPRDPWLLALGAWLALATAHALWRTPYDDEWFSIGLAFEKSDARFWYALESDIHPPWVALLDRFLIAHVPWRGALFVTHLLVAAAGLACHAKLVRRQLGMPRSYLFVAALHPIVFMYAGAARWYPFLLLAHGVRALAIFAPPTSEKRRAGLFALGSALGLAAGYVDPPLLVHDLVWFHVRGRGGRHARLSTLLTAAAALAVYLLLRAASPLTEAHERLTRLRFDFSAFGTWAGMGLIGEAGPPFPLMLLGALVVVGVAWGTLIALRDPARRTLTAFALTQAAVWACVTPLGVWHPRYSLAVWPWVGLSLLIASERVRRSGLRVVSLLAVAYLALVSALTAGAESFYKGDLNRLTQRDCAALDVLDEGTLVIASYARLAELVTRSCAPGASILVLPSIRRYERAADTLRGVDARFAGHRHVVHLATASDSVLVLVDRALRKRLSLRCTASGVRPFGAIPHVALRRRRGLPEHRFRRESWTCPVVTP